jgi:hypothetical protein
MREAVQHMQYMREAVRDPVQHMREAVCTVQHMLNTLHGVATGVRRLEIPCAKPCDQYKRDVMGQKVPNQTVAAGNAMSDKATCYENTLVTGK